MIIIGVYSYLFLLRWRFQEGLLRSAYVRSWVLRITKLRAADLISSSPQPFPRPFPSPATPLRAFARSLLAPSARTIKYLPRKVKLHLICSKLLVLLDSVSHCNTRHVDYDMWPQDEDASFCWDCAVCALLSFCKSCSLLCRRQSCSAAIQVRYLFKLLLTKL